MTPLILAVDTTSEHGSIALARGADVIEEVALHGPTGFGHVLYGAMQELLARHGVELRKVECFAAASGPGSFTGVRVALTCVKGLAEATGKRAVAVSNLEALARFGSGPLRAPVIDARRGEVYGAVYDAAGAVVLPETVAKVEAWVATLPPGVEFVGVQRVEGLPEGSFVTAPRAIAGMMAQVAAGREWLDPAALDANYVRRSDAEMYWREA